MRETGPARIEFGIGADGQRHRIVGRPRENVLASPYCRPGGKFLAFEKRQISPCTKMLGICRSKSAKVVERIRSTQPAMTQDGEVDRRIDQAGLQLQRLGVGFFRLFETVCIVQRTGIFGPQRRVARCGSQRLFEQFGRSTGITFRACQSRREVKHRLVARQRLAQRGQRGARVLQPALLQRRLRHLQRPLRAGDVHQSMRLTPRQPRLPAIDSLKVPKAPLSMVTCSPGWKKP